VVIDKCLLKWITQCRDKNIPLNGTILFEKVNEYAQQLGHINFKASGCHKIGKKDMI
jgi:hypothetical protein